MESGFPAITEPLLDHDYFLMTTYWEEQQRISYTSVPASPAAHEQAEDAISGPPGSHAPPPSSRSIPNSIEATLRGSIQSRGEVDVQRTRADKAEAKLSAIHALVTTPGIPALREHILNILRQDVWRSRLTTRSIITDP
jgi:hypothetical protein